MFLELLQWAARLWPATATDSLIFFWRFPLCSPWVWLFRWRSSAQPWCSLCRSWSHIQLILRLSCPRAPQPAHISVLASSLSQSLGMSFPMSQFPTQSKTRKWAHPFYPWSPIWLHRVLLQLLVALFCFITHYWILQAWAQLHSNPFYSAPALFAQFVFDVVPLAPFTAPWGWAIAASLQFEISVFPAAKSWSLKHLYSSNGHSYSSNDFQFVVPACQLDSWGPQTDLRLLLSRPPVFSFHFRLSHAAFAIGQALLLAAPSWLAIALLGVQNYHEASENPWTFYESTPGWDRQCWACS